MGSRMVVRSKGSRRRWITAGAEIVVSLEAAGFGYQRHDRGPAGL